MGFVGVAGHDYVVELSAYFAVGAECGGSVDFAAHVDDCVFAECYGAAQTGSFHYFGVAAYVDGAVLDVDGGGFDCGSFFDEEVGGVAYEGACGAQWL